MGFSLGKSLGSITGALTPVGGLFGSATGGDVGSGSLADFIPGIGDARAQERANKLNLQLDQMNRRWMEQMSNTSYQRAMEDMKKAGLNPMLAYQQGGASVPNTASPQVGAASKTRLADTALQAYTGISAARSQSQQAQTAQAQMESSTKLQTAQTAKEVAQAQNTMMDTALKKQDLKGWGIKKTLDLKGGHIIQKLFDSFNSNSAKPIGHENAKRGQEWLKKNKPKVLDIIEKPGYKTHHN